MNYLQRTTPTRFGSGGGFLRSAQPLDDEQIQRVTPSVFAEEKHSSRSERYTYIPTSRVLSSLRQEGFFPYEVRQGGSRIEGKREYTKHLVRLRHENAMATELGGLLREIVLLNSHDGTSSYRLMTGLFRLVCLNGLVVAQGLACEIRVPHKGDIVGNVIDGAYEIIKDSAKIDAQVERMQAIQLNGPEREAFARSAAMLRWEGDELAIEPKDLLRPRRREDESNDLWTVFNRTQEHLINGGVSYVQRNKEGRAIAHRRSRPVNSVQANIRLNQSLWALADEMARIKGGVA